MFKSKNGMMMTGLLVASILWSGLAAFGAALSASRDTPQRYGDYVGLTVASNEIIYAGAMVAVNTAGYAVPAADTAGQSVIGRAEETVDNRGVLYSAAKAIKVARGIFRWANGDAATDADIGKIAYVTDDQTVNKTGGGQNIIAGSIVDTDSSGVWVDTSRIGPLGATTPASMAVSGNATVGGTLSVTGVSTLPAVTNLTARGAFTNSGNTTVTGDIYARGDILGDGATISSNVLQYWVGTNGFLSVELGTNLLWTTADRSKTNSITTW